MSEESRMKKTIIRIAVCVVVFLASALIIGSIMNQGHNNMTMEMAPATLPMTYYKDTLQAFLDNHIHEILGKLGREFDSNDFITAFRLLFPNEYATVLRRSSSYRAIHTWVARWYLSGRTDLLQKGDIRQRQSDNRNPTKNRMWIKL